MVGAAIALRARAERRQGQRFLLPPGLALPLFPHSLKPGGNSWKVLLSASCLIFMVLLVSFLFSLC